MATRSARTRYLLFTAVIGSLALCLSAVGQKNHKRATRDQIEALEQQWRQAQLADDVPAMDKLLSEDFLGITSSGQVVTKAQQLDRMRTRTLALTHLEISDVKIKLVGQIAIVTSLAEIDGTNDDKPLIGSFRYTHVFQRLPNGTWKITNFEATRIPGSGRMRQAERDNPTQSR